MSKIILIIAMIVGVALAGFWFWDTKPWVKEMEIPSGFDLITKNSQELVKMGPKVKTILSIGDAQDFAKGGRDPRIPSTVPPEFVYPGATLQTMQQMGGRGVAIVLATSEPVGKVSSFLADKLSGAGWQKVPGALEGDEFEKGEQKAQVRVTSDDGKTVIAVGFIFKK